MKRQNIYTHEVNLKKMKIENAQSYDFTKRIEKIPYRGYELEYISDGRKIVIVKPGSKQKFGTLRNKDFLEFIFSLKGQTLWKISHIKDC
jgi:hypothetical protein